MSIKAGVLVTRPNTVAQPLIHALEAIGARVWHAPTLEIILLPEDPKVQQAISQFNTYSWHIFVSRHAVQAVMPQVVKTWSMLDLKKQHFAAVGAGTAKELERFIDCPVLYPQSQSGAMALASVLEHQIQASDTICIWCGDKPTVVWPNAHLVMCYRREKIPVKSAQIQRALAMGEIEYIVVSSGTSLECLMASLDIHRATLIVISERLMRLASTLGFTGKIILAKGPDEQSIINAIKGE